MTDLNGSELKISGYPDFSKMQKLGAKTSVFLGEGRLYLVLEVEGEKPFVFLDMDIRPVRNQQEGYSFCAFQFTYQEASPGLEHPVPLPDLKKESI